MVNRLGAADLAALAFIMRGTDGESSSMLLQLCGLMAGKEGGERLDPAEISKFVKNILDAVATPTTKEGTQLPHKVIQILTSAQLTPTKLVEPGKGETSLLSPKSDKTDPKSPNLVETAVVKEKVTEKITAQKPEGMQQHHRAEESGLKSQHLSLSPPIQQAVKEVLKALQFITPQNDKKEVEKADPHRSSVAPSSTIQPSTETKETQLPNKKPDTSSSSQKAPQAGNHLATSAKSEAKRPEDNSLDKQQTKVDTSPKEVKKEAAPVLTQPQALVEKKGAELLQNLGFKGTPQEQSTNQPRPADRTSIPIAPHQPQFSAAESRRKEKRKYPHYFSDREEGEGEQENNDPKQKKK